jgi:hypothetical protein
MRTDILHDVQRRLIADFNMVERAGWLRSGKCPNCSNKELYTHAKNPWVIKCGRINNCGYEEHVKDLYEDLFTKFNDRYKPTQEKPNATADAYMDFARGFDITKIRGWYKQEKYWHPKGDKGTATVRFNIDKDNDVYMERLIEPVTVTNEDGSKTLRKANFKGKYGGLWWQPPGVTFEDGDEVWIVEGCMDSVALNLNEVKSVANLACTNYPAKLFEAHKDKDIKWIFALDNDPAGKRYIKRYVKKAEEAGLKVGAAQIPTGNDNKKTDWNDLHQQGHLGEYQINEYRYHGQLLVAKSAFVKAMLIWNHGNRSVFSFTFNNKMYWFKTDIKKLNELIEELTTSYPDMDKKEIREKAVAQSGMLSEICNCYPHFLYFQSHEATGESWYYCNISFPNARPTLKTTFTGSQIAAPAEFKKRLLTVAPGGLFTGGSNQLNWIIKNNLSNIKQVNTIDFVGFSKEHNAYIFNDFAVKNGKIYEANSQDYIEIGKLSIKTLSGSFKFEIGKAHAYNAEWPDLIYQAFGVKGLVALTFWFGSLFAEQIRAAQKSYPFLEVVGEPGSGKTTLIEFLWKTFGLEDTEGFDPSKSTFASIRRKFAQVSNLPIVLLEGDREEASKYKKFDFNQLKDSYNGRAFGERGIKNAGNETYAPAFKAAVVISQNADVQGSDAVMQRIVHLNIDKDNHTPDTRRAADQLNQLPVNELSFFMIKSLLAERRVMENLKKSTRTYENRLLQKDKIKNIRIAKNHAQMMALADGLASVANFDRSRLQKIHTYIEILAAERERAVKTDHPMLQEFWDVYDYLNGEENYPILNHAKDKTLIAINLNHFVSIAMAHKQQLPAITDLKPLLKQTRTHKFLGIRAVNSSLLSTDGYGSRTVKCWVFEKKQGQYK